jgi:hypothetical protein
MTLTEATSLDQADRDAIASAPCPSGSSDFIPRKRTRCAYGQISPKPIPGLIAFGKNRLCVLMLSSMSRWYGQNMPPLWFAGITHSPTTH